MYVCVLYMHPFKTDRKWTWCMCVCVLLWVSRIIVFSSSTCIQSLQTSIAKIVMGFYSGKKAQNVYYYYILTIIWGPKKYYSTIIIALIFRGSKFLRFLWIQCHSRKYYFNEKFDTLHHQLLLQHIHEFFSMKLSKTAIIRKNFDLRNISTILPVYR